MPKINQEEYEVLKGLDDKYKWIARDEDRGLYAFTKKPVKKDGPSSYWWDADPYSALGLFDEIHLFQFIQWEDEEPYDIQELIEEYLYDNQPKLFIDGQEQSFEFIEESEEKEVKKDIEWLKKWIYEYEDEIGSWLGDKHTGDYFSTRLHGSLSAIKEIREKLNQLDEPETLSEDWIQEHSYNVHLLGTPDVTTVAVPREDLQNLLVPKQEELESKIKVLIEAYKQEEDAYSNPENGWIGGFIEDLKILVEEEQKYYVLDSEEIPLLERVNNQTCKTTTGLSIYEDGRDNSRFELTEQEIKDYDERFWPFAVKVEELKEC